MAALPAIISMILGGAVLFVARKVCKAVSELVSKFEKFMAEHRLLLENARNDNKSHIVAVYEKGKERGYLTPTEHESVNRLYDSYRALGGNSYIGAVMHEINHSTEIVGMPIPAIVAAMDAAGKEQK